MLDGNAAVADNTLLPVSVDGAAWWRCHGDSLGTEASLAPRRNPLVVSSCVPGQRIFINTWVNIGPSPTSVLVFVKSKGNGSGQPFAIKEISM